MSSLNSSQPPGNDTGTQVRTLPRRDYYLLPLLSLLTVVCMVSVAEFGARLFWPEHGEDSCLIKQTPTGPRFRPNCKSRVKTPEGPWVDNAYNECGYRTRESCRRKDPGVIRVAVLGASFSYGYFNRYEDAYTSLVGASLSRKCRKPVEFQNLGVAATNPVDVYRRTGEALALKPDVLLWAVDPIDIRTDLLTERVLHRDDAWIPPGTWDVGQESWLKKHIVVPLKSSRAITVLQHYMYQNPDTFLSLYLLYADTSVGFLKASYSPQWQERVHALDVLMGAMKQKADAASVPLVILLGPTAAQVALENTASRPGLDAFSFSRQVEEVGARDGVPVIDSLPQMKDYKHPMSLFFITDGHLGPTGQVILANTLESQIRSAAPSVFAGCSTN